MSSSGGSPWRAASSSGRPRGAAAARATGRRRPRRCRRAPRAPPAARHVRDDHSSKPASRASSAARRSWSGGPRRAGSAIATARRPAPRASASSRASDASSSRLDHRAVGGNPPRASTPARTAPAAAGSRARRCRPVLVADAQHVAEAARHHQQRRLALALEQRVRRDGGAEPHRLDAAVRPRAGAEQRLDARTAASAGWAGSRESTLPVCSAPRIDGDHVVKVRPGRRRSASRARRRSRSRGTPWRTARALRRQDSTGFERVPISVTFRRV